MPRIHAFGLSSYFAVPLAVAALLAAGCAAAGGGGNPPVPAVSPTLQRGATAVTIRIDGPAATSNSKNRKPQYLSPATKSISIQVNSGTPAAQNITTGSPGCTTPTVISPLTCEVVINAPPGKDTFVIQTYDQPNTGVPPAGGYVGSVLSASTFTFTVIAGQKNVITTTLDGYPASLTISALPDSPYFIGSSTSGFVSYGTNRQHVSINAYDADKNLIIGSGAPTISLSATANVQVATPSPSAAPVWSITNTQFDQAGMLTATATALQTGPPAVTLTTPIRTQHRVWYVADHGTTIWEYYDGQPAPHVKAMVDPLEVPSGVMVDSQGTITVPMSAGDPKQFLTGQTAPSGSLDQDLNLLGGVTGGCVDHNGNLYFARPSHVYEYIVGNDTTAGSDTLVHDFPASNPIACAAAADDSIWVIDNGSGTPSIEHFAPFTAIPDQSWNPVSINPISIAVDRAGELFVGNSNGTIDVYLAGAQQPTVTMNLPTVLGIPADPVGLSVDIAGKLYVVDASATNNVNVYSPPFTKLSNPNNLGLQLYEGAVGIATYP